MAKARLKKSGKWEIGLRHPLLPGGRKYFTFDTEAEANAYADQWRTMKQAGLSPPAELLEEVKHTSVTLGALVRTFANSGLAAPTQQSSLGSLITEVGTVQLTSADYTWLMAYIQRLKTENNLAPGSIRQRIQALGRSIDEYLRHNPKVAYQSPIRLLPKGYSAYSEIDSKLVQAKGGLVKVDVTRDRRLHPGEESKIIWALSGNQREDRSRPLELRGGNALLTMYLVIVNSGIRLREAYTLTRGQVDLENKVLRVKCTKMWRGKIAYRDVPMRPEVHDAIVTYLSTRPAMLPGAMLFPFMDEEPDMTLTRCSQRLSARFRIAFQYAGITDDLLEHDLRHEATCRWLELRDESGQWLFRFEEINRIMGWKPGSVMAARYASFRGTDLAQRLWVKKPVQVVDAAG